MSWHKFFLGLANPSSIEGLEGRVKDLEEDVERLRARIVKLESGPEPKFGEKVRFMNKKYLYVDAIYIRKLGNGMHSVVWWDEERNCVAVSEELNVVRLKDV